MPLLSTCRLQARVSPYTVQQNIAGFVLLTDIKEANALWCTMVKVKVRDDQVESVPVILSDVCHVTGELLDSAMFSYPNRQPTAEVVSNILTAKGSPLLTSSRLVRLFHTS